MIVKTSFGDFEIPDDKLEGVSEVTHGMDQFGRFIYPKPYQGYGTCFVQDEDVIYNFSWADPDLNPNDVLIEEVVSEINRQLKIGRNE